MGEVREVSFKRSKFRNYRTEVLLELGRQIRGPSNLGLVGEAKVVKTLGLSGQDALTVSFGPKLSGGARLNHFP
jgi:hypothetical protein